MKVKNTERVEGIRKTATGWAVVLSAPTDCASHSGFPGKRTLILGAEFSGPGSKGQAIEAAGTNRVIEGSASSLVAA